jgi:drug/metabolite transporter (DMT)-like permease
LRAALPDRSRRIGSDEPIQCLAMDARTVLLTAASLVCFAGNSLLCRMALAERQIDAASFTGIRIASGALALALLAVRRPRAPATGRSWLSAVALFAYAAPFSFAYLSIGAGVGALILFASVQATMIGWGIARGERPRPAVWAGLAIALAGLVALTIPGRAAPDPLGAAVMALAGAAWGIYSLRGRTAGGDPIAANAVNFARSVPLAAALVAVAGVTSGLGASPRGVLLAALSGAVASGLGYSVWYTALRGLTATRAGIVQLIVPVLAAGGGAAFLGERPSLRVIVAAAAILGGVALAVRGKGA